MEIKKLNIIISLGFVAIIGILIAQLLWTRQAYNLEDKNLIKKLISLYWR
jgi:two-component system phosphate regulon sensor histidine kinase PhoR